MAETIAESGNENYAVTVGTSATVLVEGSGQNQSARGVPSRGGTVTRPRQVYVHNADAASDVLYLGFGSDTTTGNGLPIAAGDYRLLLLHENDELWAIASAASTPVRVLIVHGKGNPA